VNRETKEHTMNFESFFRRATRTASEPDGRKPYPYQIAFAQEPDLSDLLNIPTGVGKTATAKLGWLYRRQCDAALRAKTPRRLVYCLPMRTPVEQARQVARTIVERLLAHECAKVYERRLAT
jgi:CRISPR-associated endonuclease/helicase Cas3